MKVNFNFVVALCSNASASSLRLGRLIFDQSHAQDLQIETRSGRHYYLAVPHYNNWKTKRRRPFTVSQRYLEKDDDELFFDSNGMPIQHDDDDDIGEIRAPVNNGATNETNNAAGKNIVKPKQQQHKGVNNNEAPAHNTKLFNNTHHQSDETPPDTILDDILRGFSFAFLFCIFAMCLHKLCWYSCIRCGIVPDDRLAEARWKRHQLKHKRAYFNPNAPASMDAKSLGKWFDQRDKMYPDGYAGIWDSSGDRSVGSWDEESGGAIDFDEGIQLSSRNRDDASAATELEYGEGEELEDKSHDERLFDVEDGGAGLKKQANKFFDGTKKLFSKKKTESKKQSKATSKDNTSNNSFETESKNDVSDDAFFDALQPPSGRVDAFSGNADTEDSLNTANHPFQHHDDPQTTAGNHQNQNDVQQSRNDDCFNDDMLLDDRGYDEESDLLGLRSDSPPPLDLEEIEKKMLKNMENAKSYY